MDIQTEDIVFAAALKYKGCKLLKIEKSIMNKGTFFFVDVDEGVETSFYLGDMRVEPEAFNNAIKSLTTAVRRVINY